MRGAQHQGNFVRAVVELHILGDADKAREVALGVADAVLKNGEAVELAAVTRGDHRHIVAPGSGDEFGGGGGIAHFRGLDLRVIVEEGAALAQGLFVGDDLAHVLKARAGKGHQFVLDALARGADDGEVVLFHQIVHLRDRTGGAVFNGQNAIGTHALFHGGKDVVEGVHVEYVGELEHVVAGLLRVGALRALAGDQRAVGQFFLFARHGLFQPLHQRRTGGEQRGLVAAAQIEHGLVEQLGVALQPLARLFGDAVEHFALAAAVEDGQAVFLLVGGHVAGDLHAAHEQFQHLIVDLVDGVADVLEFHRRYAPSSIISANTSAVTASTTGTARGTMQGSWRPATTREACSMV